jgi:two-component system cell cycle response regulator DivK
VTDQKRILIVDDDPDHRCILVYRLQKIGQFEILEARNGQEALDVVSQEWLDLVVLNIGMPVLDGWETVRRIRAMSQPACTVPVIAHTAYALPGDEPKALNAGCDDYLAKPVVDFALLEQKVRRLLAKHRAS